MLGERGDRYDQEWVSYTELDGTRRLIPKTSKPQQVARTTETKPQLKKPSVRTSRTALRQ